MHYIRLLRPPTLSRDKSTPAVSVSIVLTVTTDLSDSLLSPGSPTKLKVSVYPSRCDVQGRKPQPNEILSSSIVEWQSGARVLKTELRFSPGPAVSQEALRVSVFPTAQVWGGSSSDVVSSLDPATGRGRIMPVWADLEGSGAGVDQVSLRRLRLGKEDAAACLEFEEDFGETMARHVWDGGLTAASLLIEHGLGTGSHQGGGGGALPSKVLDMIAADRPRSTLELGCGVGTLGLALAAVLAADEGSLKHKHSLVLTDLPEAQQRAEANIARAASTLPSLANVDLAFESLDWEQGRLGKFGRLVGARRPWDLIMLSDCTYNIDVLPLLVDTLSALHAANTAHHRDAAAAAATGTSESPARTRVLLATKHRHESEKAVFKLLASAGWSVDESDEFSLPVLGGKSEVVEVYLFGKS